MKALEKEIREEENTCKEGNNEASLKYAAVHSKSN